MVLYNNYTTDLNETYLGIICDRKTGDFLGVSLQMSLTACMKVLHHHHTATSVCK